MSLIQEALRRQREETEGKTQAAGAPPSEMPAPPPLPVPAPTTVQPPAGTPAAPEAAPQTPGDKPAAARRPLTSILGVVIVALALIGAVVWLLAFAYGQWKAARGPAVTSVAAAPARSRPAPVTPAPATPPTPAPPPAPVVPAPEPAPAASTQVVPAVASAPATASSAPAATTAAVSAAISAPVTATNTAAASAAREEPVAAPVTWPYLSLKGVIGRGAAGSAIINDQVVAVNETVEGALVTAVRNQGVDLEYKGEKRFLKVGSSTR